MRVVFVAALVFGCSGGGSAMNPGSDAAAETSPMPEDGATDATVGEMDTGADGDAACQTCGYGHCPDRALCLNAPTLQPGVPVTMQDTAAGGYDCAVSASGGGAPTLYYAFTVPAHRTMHVAATPADPSVPALVRVLSDCYAPMAETAGRGGNATQGRASLCLNNETNADRRVVLAVSIYSGGLLDTLVFDLVAELPDPNFGCVP